MNADKSYSQLCENIIRLLQQERKRRGVSKYMLERQSGISQQMIGYLERGLRKPSLEIALRFADGLGLDLADVIKKGRKMAPQERQTKTD